MYCAPGNQADLSRSLPTLLLLLATVSALFSGIALGNHSKLVDCEFKEPSPTRRSGLKLMSLAVGPLFIPSVLANSRLVKGLEILRNPFTLTVIGSSAAILAGSIVVPP